MEKKHDQYHIENTEKLVNILEKELQMGIIYLCEKHFLGTDIEYTGKF